jgi:hypothetical protein
MWPAMKNEPENKIKEMFQSKTGNWISLSNNTGIKSKKPKRKTGSGLIVQVTREAQVGVEHVNPLQSPPKLDYIKNI